MTTIKLALILFSTFSNVLGMHFFFCKFKYKLSLHFSLPLSCFLHLGNKRKRLFFMLYLILRWLIYNRTLKRYCFHKIYVDQYLNSHSPASIFGVNDCLLLPKINFYCKSPFAVFLGVQLQLAPVHKIFIYKSKFMEFYIYIYIYVCVCARARVCRFYIVHLYY